MDETSKASPQPLDSKRLVGLIVVGLLLAETILVVIVALTRDVILPGLAMAMGDTSSPLSLGKQDFNFPDLLTAVLQLCLAGIVAIILSSWVNKKPKVSKTKSLKLTPSTVQPPVPKSPAPMAAASIPVPAAAPSAAPSSAAPSPQATAVAKAQFTPLTSSQPTPVAPAVKPQVQSAPTPTPPKAQPSKPKQPKEVYYNIVGERITPEDDDEETSS